MSVLLVGDATPNYTVPSNISNVEEAFRYTALASGTLAALRFKTSATDASTATSVQLGIYADAAGSPGALLGSGTYAGVPPVDTWIEVTGLSVAIVGGQDYWLTVLAVDGTLQYQSAVAIGSGGTDDWITDDAFTTLQDPWPGTTSGNKFDDGPVGFQGLTEGASAAPSDGGLTWQVTGLWYPDAESVDFYGTIADPQGGEVVIPLNDSRTAKVTVSVHEPIAAEVFGHAYARMLRCYYRGHLVFWGPYKVGNVNMADGTFEINAVDPSLRAVRHYLRRDDLDGELSATNNDRGTVSIDADGMKLVLDAARNIPSQTLRGCPDIGIAVGTNDFTAAPDNLIGVARGDEVWNTELQIAQALGPDFELEPITSTVGAYSRLNTYAHQGTDKSATVVFHYGTGRDNLENLEPTEGSQYITHAHVLDRTLKFRRTTVDVESSAETGQYTYWDATDFDSTGIPEAQVNAVLDAYGQDLVNAYGRPLLECKLTLPIETEDSFHYLHDFAVGDTVGVAGRAGVIRLEEAPYRITTVTLAQAGPTNSVRLEIDVVASRVVANGDTITGSEDS